MNTPQTFIFIGRSGSGKGTQAELLKDYLEKNTTSPVTYLQTGQRFRDFSKGESHTAKITRELMKTGELMPEFLGVWNWSSIFVESIKGDEHLILDGMPRRVREAQILDTAVDFYRLKNPMVIFIDIPEEEARKRLVSRGRADDNHDDIDRRMAWFETEVRPVLNYYLRDNKYYYLGFDGLQSVEDIHSDIIKTYNRFYGNNN